MPIPPSFSLPPTNTIVGDDGDNFLPGTTGDDIIKGLGGDDNLFGAEGDDQLLGGAGDDYLQGVYGDNTLNGGAGIDTASLSLAAPADGKLDLGDLLAQKSFTVENAWGGHDTVTGVERLAVTISDGRADITGSDVNDQISTYGFANRIHAGASFDLVTADSGSSVFGEDGNDYLQLGFSASSARTSFNGGEGDDAVQIDTDQSFSNLHIKATKTGFKGYTDNHLHDFVATDVEHLFAVALDVSATVQGGAGDDFLWSLSFSQAVQANFDGGGGNDSIRGATGDDTLKGGDGNDSIDGGAGSDTLDGGAGFDKYGYNIGHLDGEVWVIDASGFDTSGGKFKLDQGDGTVDTLMNFEAARLIGLADQQNHLIGSNGGDGLLGGELNDTVEGGAGDDILGGGGSADTLTGGGGADHFRYVDPGESVAGEADLITDLSAKDIIDLTQIDADVTQDGDQAFQLVKSLSGHAGQLALSYDAGSGLTTLAADVDGDGVGDLVVQIQGDHRDFSGFFL